jgi:hypothetical protein
MKREYPQDFFIEINGDDYRVGRLTLSLLTQAFSVEIAIVQKESKKIVHHVETLYGISDRDEALASGVQRLSQFLKGKG